jgi:hypothetical protein
LQPIRQHSLKSGLQFNRHFNASASTPVKRAPSSADRIRVLTP